MYLTWLSPTTKILLGGSGSSSGLDSWIHVSKKKKKWKSPNRETIYEKDLVKDIKVRNNLKSSKQGINCKRCPNLRKEREKLWIKSKPQINAVKEKADVFSLKIQIKYLISGEADNDIEKKRTISWNKVVTEGTIEWKRDYKLSQTNRRSQEKCQRYDIQDEGMRWT